VLRKQAGQPLDRSSGFPSRKQDCAVFHAAAHLVHLLRAEADAEFCHRCLRRARQAGWGHPYGTGLGFMAWGSCARYPLISSDEFSRCRPMSRSTGDAPSHACGAAPIPAKSLSAMCCRTHFSAVATRLSDPDALRRAAKRGLLSSDRYKSFRWTTRRGCRWRS